MTTKEAIKILYEIEGKTAYSGELGGLAIQMAIEALNRQEQMMKDLPKWKPICSFQSFTDDNVFIEGNCLRWGNRVVSLNDLKNLPMEE